MGSLEIAYLSQNFVIPCNIYVSHFCSTSHSHPHCTFEFILISRAIKTSQSDFIQPGKLKNGRDLYLFLAAVWEKALQLKAILSKLQCERKSFIRVVRKANNGEIVATI